MGQAGLPWAIFSLAGPGYFRAMHIPLLRGRDVTAADTYGSQPVVVISAALARQSFGNEDPLGKQIICGMDEESHARRHHYRCRWRCAPGFPGG